MAKKGFKRAPRDLDEWIRLANLIRPGQARPQRDEIVAPGVRWSEVVERLAKLDDPLRSELLAVGGVDIPQDMRKWLTIYDQEDRLDDYIRILGVLHHYSKIETADHFLRLLARSPNEQTMDILESFVSTLRYAELGYIRECGYCGALFYAGRKTKFGCTDSHSSNIRKKRKRERDKKNLELAKKRAKKKRASKARTTPR